MINPTYRRGVFMRPRAQVLYALLVATSRAGKVEIPLRQPEQGSVEGALHSIAAKHSNIIRQAPTTIATVPK